MTTLHIPDLSQHNGSVTMSEIGPAVILRAHNGYRADATFKQRLARSRRFQTVRMFYGYCVADRNPVTQARELAAIVGPLQRGEAFVCDLETGAGNQTPRMIAYLNELAGVDIDYSGLSFAQDHLQNRPRGLLMWLAAYRATEPSEQHFLWQHTDHEIHAGVSTPCDCSIFHGTVTELRDLISPPAPVPPKPHIDPTPKPKPKPVPAPAPIEPVQEDDMALIAKDPDSTSQYVLPVTLDTKVHIASMADLQALMGTGRYTRVSLSAAQLADALTLTALPPAAKPT